MAQPELASGFIPSPLHLYERDVLPDRLQRLNERISHAASVWMKEAVNFRRDPLEIVKAGWEGRRVSSPIAHAIDGLEFVGLMDYGDRASNGLRIAIGRDNRDVSHPSAFGTLLTRAYNNPKLADHNHEHNRRTERWNEAMLLNVGELRHAVSVVKWIDSMYLYDYFHDVDQLVSMQHNHETKAAGKNELKVKHGHSLGAAIILLALHERYAGERVVGKREAWEKAAGAAFMTIRHDEPENLGKVLSAARPAFSIEQGKPVLLHGDELKQAYDRFELDLTTIAPSQILELLRYTKEKSGFMRAYGGESRWGLHPSFEREYTKELAALWGNDQPLIRFMSPETKASLHLATEVAVRADLIEMVAPPVEAMFRTMGTQYSKNRPFFRTRGLSKYVNTGRERNGLERIALAREDALVYAAMHGEGNMPPELDSDVLRMLWEFSHIDNLDTASDIKDSAYIRKISRDNAIMGVLTVKSIGNRIMLGDLGSIDDAYAKRVVDVGKKALRSAGYRGFRLALAARKARDGGQYTQDIEALLARSGDHELTRRFSEKTSELALEAERLKAGIAGKPEDDGMPGTGVRVYREHEIADFNRSCDRILQYLFERFNVGPHEQKRFRIRALQGKFPTSTPYKHYDSLGSPARIRTLVRPQETA